MEFYHSLSAAELQKKAAASAKTAAKKGKHYEPVIAHGSGRELYTSWWGKAWGENLMRYADYENRLPRGKRYVRNGALLDLQIKRGEVTARVQGSRPRPYTVTIHISPLPQKKMDALLERCSRKVSSLEALVQGEFPKEMEELLAGEGGIFPTPKEIRFDCSCPDWASMCKHVACVMFGIGVKLDENPFYFFELRGIDTDSLLTKTVENKVAALLENAEKPSSRILDEEQMHTLFSL